MGRRAITLDDLRGAARDQAVNALADQAIAAERRRQKYGAEPTTVDGHRFASKFEARHYGELLQRQRAGEISGLELHPSFDLIVNGVLICRYVADFAYTESGKRVVADTKGVSTPVYRIKAKLMLACHGIKILEVRRS